MFHTKSDIPRQLFVAFATAIVNIWFLIYSAEMMSRLTGFAACAYFIPTSFLRLNQPLKSGVHGIAINFGAPAAITSFLILFLGWMIRCRRPTNKHSSTNKPDLMEYWLKRAGKCPWEIKRLALEEGLKADLSQQSEGNHDHSHCWNRECQYELVAQSPNQPKHHNSICTCPLVQVSSGDLEAVLNENKIPLFTFQKKAAGVSLVMHRCTIEVMQSTRYIAISHARVAGLGNDRSNGLPECQLSLLQSFVDDLTPSAGSPTPFWIDTLCLPINSWTRRPFLYSVHEIFRGANGVLVIDPSLLQKNILSPHENARQIRESFWTKRVWTVWEGMLTSPASLKFQFQNGAISLEELLAPPCPPGPPQRLFSVSVYEKFWNPSIFQSAPAGLDGMIVNLANDMMTWADHFNKRGAGDDSYFDKVKLYHILRLSCLSLPKFHPLRDSRESQYCEMAKNTIIQVFGESGSSRDDDIQQVIARLDIIERTPIE